MQWNGALTFLPLNAHPVFSTAILLTDDVGSSADLLTSLSSLGWALANLPFSSVSGFASWQSGLVTPTTGHLSHGTLTVMSVVGASSLGSPS